MTIWVYLNGLSLKFYTAGSSQIAVRTMVDDGQDSLTWVLSDHLGSTSVTANANGTSKSEIKYTAFGEVRSSSGTTDTPYQYTGQLSQMEQIGLYYYVARFYDPAIAHFAQADTIVPGPGNPLAYNRFAYALFNPLRYIDPNGHASVACVDGSDRPGCVNNPISISVIVHSGSYANEPGSIEREGPEPYIQVPIWMDDYFGKAVTPIRYPGSKRQQAVNSRTIVNTPSDNLIIIGYSAGTESALMDARWRIDHGQKVEAVVLLGPTFAARDEEGNVLGFGTPSGEFNDWADYIQYLLQNNVDVLVVDDKADYGAEAKGIFDDSQGYRYEYIDVEHYTAYDSTSTNNNQELEDSVYKWIYTYEWMYQP